MEDEVFAGLGPLGSPRLLHVSLMSVEYCRNSGEAESSLGRLAPRGLPWIPWSFFFRNLRKTLWMMKFFGG